MRKIEQNEREEKERREATLARLKEEHRLRELELEKLRLQEAKEKQYLMKKNARLMLRKVITVQP